MSNNTLRLSTAFPQTYAMVQLGTHKNTGAKVFTDPFSIIVEGGTYPMLGLPPIFPPCDWATITVIVTGCVSKAGVIVPVPLAGLPVFPYPPPLGFVVAFAPWTPSVPSVTVVAPVRGVGLAPPGVQSPAVGPGILDALATPGSLYKLSFAVTPNFGVFGARKWELPVLSAGVKVGTIALVATMIEPLRLDSSLV